GVSDGSENLSRLHPLAYLDADATGLKVLVERVASPADVEGHVVARGVGERGRGMAAARGALRHVGTHCRDPALRGRQDIGPVAVPVRHRVLGRRGVAARVIVPEPVDRETPGDSPASADGIYDASMAALPGGVVSRNP